MKLEGVITALVTPFVNGDVDFEGLKQNIQRQLQAGVDGILVLGTTGESPTITDEERIQIIQLAVQEVKGKALVLAGTGSNCTQKTIKYTQEAKDLGADVALIVTPYYNCPTQEGIYRHFVAVSSAVDLPVCVYNIQKRTGRNIETTTMKRIVALSTVVAVKEASGNIDQVQDVITKLHSVDPDITVLSGDDAMTLATIALGGVGVISVASNLIPEAVVELVDTAVKGGFSLAQQFQNRLLPLFRVLFIETNPIPIKAAMKQWEMVTSDECRLPLCSMQEETHDQLCGVLSQYEELKMETLCCGSKKS